jgi:hypothetical protein
LGKWVLIGIFLLKVSAGLAYAYFYSLPAYRPTSDTFRFFDYSLQETDWLLKNPLAFFKDIFSHGYQETGNVFIGENSYWNDLKSNVIIKLLAICNVFTGKNYYADIVFFNFLFLFGIIAFYRLLNGLFPQKKWLLLISIACTPSFLFWCSGIHKDGLLFSALGLVFWLFHQSLNSGFSIKRLIGIIFCLAAIFVLRNYVCLALFPAFAGWYFSRKNNSLRAFAIVYAVSIIAFFSTSSLPAKFNLLNYFSIKQAEFMQLSGGSSVSLKKLEPTASSFVGYLPSALDMALLRPHISEMKNKSYLPAIAEILLLFALLAFFLFNRNKTNKIPAAVWACWLFAITILLVAGYSITFSGAIVRYRSLALPFVIAPLVCLLKIPQIRKNRPIHTN